MTEPLDVEQPRSTTASVFFWISLLVLVALFAYAVSAAVGNWIGIARFADTLAEGLSTRGMLWLAVGVAIPVIAFMFALLVGRKRSRPTKLLILLLGLALTGAMQLNVTHFVPTTTYFDVDVMTGQVD